MLLNDINSFFRDFLFNFVILKRFVKFRENRALQWIKVRLSCFVNICFSWDLIRNYHLFLNKTVLEIF